MTPKAVSAGELQHLSASQFTTWKSCNRKWWFEKVAGIPQPTGPALDLGISIHGQMENYYEEGVIPEHPSARLLVESGVIPARGPGVFIEHPRDFKLGISVAGVPIRGRVDLILNPLEAFDDSRDPLEIWDWKSKKDLKYSKTPAELERDIQMMLYGKFAYERLFASTVTFHHANIRTADDKGPGYRIVSTDEISRDDVDSFVETVVEPLVSEIKVTATASTHEDVPPNWGACYEYNKPCPYLDRCTKDQSASVHLSMLFKGEGEMGVQTGTSLKEALGAVTNEAFAPAKGETSSTRPELHLYVNALPVKGVGRVTYLDDIIAEAGREICAAKKVLDLRLLAYGEGKALLAAGLRQNPPCGVVVATSGELSDVAIETLLPLAAIVVRGTR